MSTMDGLSVGVPYVLPAGLCYPEMVGADWPLTHDGSDADFLRVVEDALDDPRGPHSQAALDVAARFTWTRTIEPIARMFDRAFASLPVMKATDNYRRVADMARAGATKRAITDAMGWGVRVPWTQYRTRLRADGITPRLEPFEP
jgi:hypothetical protein